MEWCIYGKHDHHRNRQSFIPSSVMVQPSLDEAKTLILLVEDIFQTKSKLNSLIQLYGFNNGRTITVHGNVLYSI
jgi:hypothetical protein